MTRWSTHRHTQHLTLPFTHPTHPPTPQCNTLRRPSPVSWEYPLLQAELGAAEAAEGLACCLGLGAESAVPGGSSGASPFSMGCAAFGSGWGELVQVGPAGAGARGSQSEPCRARWLRRCHGPDQRVTRGTMGRTSFLHVLTSQPLTPHPASPPPPARQVVDLAAALAARGLAPAAAAALLGRGLALGLSVWVAERWVAGCTPGGWGCAVGACCQLRLGSVHSALRLRVGTGPHL